MATINATVTIGSDITGGTTSISKTMTMTKAGTNVGLDNTSGLSAKTVQTEIGYGEDLAAATVETIGRLYGGAWMLIPWDAVAATTHDIYAKSSTAETMTLEFMAFIE